MKHINNGLCPKCHEIIDRYPGFNRKLLEWFITFQSNKNYIHVSCAGRGELDQEAAFHNKSSKAHWGKSAHNFNCALDLFEMAGDIDNIYEPDILNLAIKEYLEPWVHWYGVKGEAFFELVHVELRDWEIFAKQGIVKIVEKKAIY